MRALALRCPACHSRGGEPCVDMRSVGKRKRKVVQYLHPERQQLIVDADRAVMPPLRLVAG